MIYLDNSATTQVDKDVAMTACEVMTEVYGNPSSPYLLGRDALGRKDCPFVLAPQILLRD